MEAAAGVLLVVVPLVGGGALGLAWSWWLTRLYPSWFLPKWIAVTVAAAPLVIGLLGLALSGEDAVITLGLGSFVTAPMGIVAWFLGEIRELEAPAQDADAPEHLVSDHDSVSFSVVASGPVRLHAVVFSLLAPLAAVVLVALALEHHLAWLAAVPAALLVQMATVPRLGQGMSIHWDHVELPGGTQVALADLDSCNAYQGELVLFDHDQEVVARLDVGTVQLAWISRTLNQAIDRAQDNAVTAQPPVPAELDALTRR